MGARYAAFLVLPTSPKLAILTSPSGKRATISSSPPIAWMWRVQAAERDMSLSRFISELLQERRRHSREYEEAMRGSLAEKPFKLKGPWKPYPKREELYDRPVFRRR
jgi:hypothetical protein